MSCKTRLRNEMLATEDPRVVVWFDIDNTLYSANSKISQAMGKKIHGDSITNTG